MRTLSTSAAVTVAALALVALVGCNPSTSNPAAGPTCVPITGASPAAVAPASPIDLSSPQGVIVYADGDLTKGTGRLHVVWPDKSHLADLTPQLVSGFAVSPDRTTIEFDGPNGAFLVGLDGTGERAIPLGFLQHADTFRWAGAGSWLAFHGWSTSDPNAEGLYRIDPNGCQPVAVDTTGVDHQTPIAVAPDGSSILAYGNVTQSSQKLAVGSLHVDRPADKSGTLLGAQGSTSLVEKGSGPPAAYSPDGKTIAFTSASVSAAQWSATANGLYLADATGSNVKSLVASGIVSGVAWSPDGQWIATTRVDPNGLPQVFIVKVDGSSAQYLTKFQSPGACCPVWSPDGASLLTWGGTIIQVSGSGASIVSPAAFAGPYAYAWVKP